MERKPIQIDVWKGDWGLPSVDLDCLQFLTYLRLANVEVKVKIGNPFFSPTGKLPVVRLSKSTITEYKDLVEYAVSKNINPDHGLTGKQVAETYSYALLLKEKLEPALQYMWWIDQVNQNAVTRPWYSKALPFPLNFYYPGHYSRKAKEMISALYSNYENAKDVEAQIIGDAEKCLTTMSIRLGDSSDFMFGAHPRSLDAIIFAYLAPLLKAPFKSVVLQNHLKNCPNLVKLVTRIQKRYFKQDLDEYETKRKEELKKLQSMNNTDFPHKTRNQILASLFATIAMISYALSTGIVQSSVDEKHFEDDQIFDPSEEYPESEN